jgi:5-methylcytosine-specific restriction endonuclease McrA
MTIRSGVVGKTGRLRLKGKAMDALRVRVFERDNWQCQECFRFLSLVTGHLAHIKSRGAGGSDTEENTRLLCMACHHAEHCPKAVPRKPYAQGE